jgi:hypothetical protein
MPRYRWSLPLSLKYVTFQEYNINIKGLRSLFIFRVSQLLPSQPFCAILHATRMSVKRPLPFPLNLSCFFSLELRLRCLLGSTCALRSRQPRASLKPIALSLDKSSTDCLPRVVLKFEISSHGGYALSWPGSERPERSLHRQETTAGLCLACYVRPFRVLLLKVDCLTIIIGMNTRRKSLQRVSDTSDYRTKGIFYSDFKTGHPVFAL